MKSFRFLLAIALIGILFTYTGCGKDPVTGPSEQDKQLTLLGKTWKATSVTLNGAAPSVPVPSGYVYGSTAGGPFILDIPGGLKSGTTNFNYTTSGGPTGSKTPWPKAGSFTFGTDFSTTLTRDDGFTINYTVSAAALQMTFTTGSTFAGYDARVENVTGVWVFNFIPN